MQTDIARQLMRLQDLSAEQLEVIRRGDLDTLEILEAERQELLAILSRDDLADLAQREPDLIGEVLRSVVANDRLARAALRQNMGRLEAEMGRTETQQRAERAYLKMANPAR